jgi:hypothetical protein
MRFAIGFRKTVLIASVATLLLVLFLPSVALAQNGGASSGTLMAAALETAGYKTQGLILTQMADVIESLAVLIFVICAVSGVVTIGLGGSYKMGLWFLLAPAIFHTIIDWKITSGGAEWQMGAYNNQAAVYDALGETVNADVSWVFHRINVLVSSVVQETIKLLTFETEKRQMMFMSRQKILDDIMGLDITEPSLKQFVVWSNATCHDVLGAARNMALGDRDPQFQTTKEYVSSHARYNHPEYGYSAKQFRLPEGPRIYVQALLQDLRSVKLTNSTAYDAYRDGIGGQCLGTGMPNPNEVYGAVSCEQLWCWMGVGLRTMVSGELQNSAARHMQSDIDAATYRQILADVEVKMLKCLHDPNSTHEDKCARDADDKIIRPTVNPDDPSLLPVIIGGYIMRKALTKDQRGAMMSTFAEHSGISGQSFSFGLDLTKEQRQEVVRKMKQHQQAISERAQVYTFAMTVPYIQGVLLFGLAMTFPFFATLVLIPGKASAIFQWVGLWFWVKSWDIGWAIVSIIDNILWELMPHSSKYDIQTDPNHGPISVFEHAFQGDPTYSVAFYWTLIGMLVVGVPMLSAQVVLGGKKIMVGMLLDGIKQMGNTYGTAMEKAESVSQGYQFDNLRETGVAAYVGDKIKKEEAATKAAEEARKKAEERKEEGGFWSSFGKGLAIVGGVALLAAATVVTGGAALVVAGAGVAAVGGGALANQHGVGQQRLANGEIASLNKANAALHQYNAGRLESTMMLDELRAGVTNRGEFWNMADACTGALAAIENIGQDADYATSGSLGYMYGGMTRTAADVATRGATM